jgi:NADH:ubiquinone oxidoreductase subunit 6 (subunit J)
MTWLMFGAAAATAVGSGWMAVSARDLVRAVLWLGLSLLATAVVYATLDAGFLAAMQVLLYTGGVVTLMLFAVMLVRREDPQSGAAEGAFRALLPAGLAVVVVASTVLRTPLTAQGHPVGTRELGEWLLGDLALPFEALSILLLAAMIAAIVLARRNDP